MRLEELQTELNQQQEAQASASSSSQQKKPKPGNVIAGSNKGAFTQKR
jgi:hypothetical protein